MQSPRAGKISVEIQEKYEKKKIRKNMRLTFYIAFLFFFLDVLTLYAPSHKDASATAPVFPYLLLLSFFLHRSVHITLSNSHAFVLYVIKFT